MEKKSYLEHLAGLRGIAIMLVVLFHLEAAIWPQGYLGVDVFLVMTGYLLFRGRLSHEEPDRVMDVLRYLWRRIQRIMAPMCLVIVLTLGLGLLFLSSANELFACRLGYNACLLKANMMLRREFDNYFATDAAYIPLLHLWYLSVAMQIYLIYAVGNYCLQRLAKRWIVSVLVLIGAASLLLHYSFPIHEWLQELGLPVWKQTKPISYYETLPRLWEVLAGGLVCCLPSLRSRVWASLCAGGGLIAVVVFGLVGSIPGTAGLAILPSTLIVVMGTMAVMRYLPESHFPRLLSRQPLLWLGKISFSVYLVHMPIIVFWRMWTYGVPDAGDEVLMVLASLLVGWGFWWCIEKRRSAWWLVLLLWVGAMLLCRTGRKTKGFRQYMPFATASITRPSYPEWQLCEDKELTSPWNPEIRTWWSVFDLLSVEKPAHIDAPVFAAGDQAQKATILLMGDSHALHLYAGMDHAFRQAGLSGVYLASPVYPFFGWEVDAGDPDTKYTAEKEQAVYDWLAAHPQITHVMLSQRWLQKWDMPKVNKKLDFERDLRRFVEKLHSMGKEVILVGPGPEFPRVLMNGFKIAALRGEKTPSVSPTCTRADYLEIHKNVLPVLHRLASEGLCSYLDPLQSLQDGDSFKAFTDDEMLMTDDNHLSAKGSILFMDMIFPQLRQALQAPAQGVK